MNKRKSETKRSDTPPSQARVESTPVDIAPSVFTPELLRYTSVMTPRYALYDIADLRDRFNLTAGLPKGIRPHYNISPTVNAPVIISQEGLATATLMKWGLVAKGAKDTNSVFRYRTYTHASETIFSRHSWEQAVRERRCLVPANGFYELGNKKRAYYARNVDGGLRAFAGIYSYWQSPEGVMQGTFSILTTESSGDMAGTAERMPVILDKEDESDWLDPNITDTSSIHKMLRPNPVGLVKVYEVSAAPLQSPKLNRASLIDRVL